MYVCTFSKFLQHQVVYNGLCADFLFLEKRSIFLFVSGQSQYLHRQKTPFPFLSNLLKITLGQMSDDSTLHPNLVEQKNTCLCLQMHLEVYQGSMKQIWSTCNLSLGPVNKIMCSLQLYTRCKLVYCKMKLYKIEKNVESYEITLSTKYCKTTILITKNLIVVIISVTNG